MGYLPSTNWKAIVVLLAVSAMAGCQGFSTGKAASQNAPTNPIAGALTTTPATFGFGPVQIGTTQTQSGNISNTGSSNTMITQATAAGSGFSISGLSTPLTLTPGQSVPFSMSFAPPSSGSYSGSVVIASDASNSNLTIALRGIGTQSVTMGNLSVNPAAINFGNVVVGTNGSQTGSLSASGASVTVSAADLPGSDFALSGLSFPFVIPAGQSVNFTVIFTPQSSGVASASISFTSDAANTPTSETLAGTGTAAPTYKVNLSWNASTSPDVAGYNIYRRIGTTGSYIKINSVLNASTTYTDSTVTDGLTYDYETTAVNTSNEESVRSSSVQAIIPAP
jgi:hypothetical protein